jgi:hypothetical protein
MFARHHWVTAILGLIATIGWGLQGLGNAFYYRSVRLCAKLLVRDINNTQIWAHHNAAGHTMEKVGRPYLSYLLIDSLTGVVSGEDRVCYSRRKGVLFSGLRWRLRGT